MFAESRYLHFAEIISRLETVSQRTPGTHGHAHACTIYIPSPSFHCYLPPPLSPVSVLRYCSPRFAVSFRSLSLSLALPLSLSLHPPRWRHLCLHPLVAFRESPSRSRDFVFIERESRRSLSLSSTDSYVRSSLILSEVPATPSPLSLDPGESRAARASLSVSRAKRRRDVALGRACGWSRFSSRRRRRITVAALARFFRRSHLRVVRFPSC